MHFYADVREERLESVSGVCLERAQLLLDFTLHTHKPLITKLNYTTQNV